MAMVMKMQMKMNYDEQYNAQEGQCYISINILHFLSGLHFSFISNLYLLLGNLIRFCSQCGNPTFLVSSTSRNLPSRKRTKTSCRASQQLLEGMFFKQPLYFAQAYFHTTTLHCRQKKHFEKGQNHFRREKSFNVGLL